MDVGEYIKKLRIEANLSQEELGKLLGVQRAAVQKWECGRVQNLKRDTIKKLSEIFSVDPSSFIENNAQTIEIHGFKLSPKKAELYENIMKLPPDKIQEMLNYMKYLNSQDYKNEQ